MSQNCPDAQDADRVSVSGNYRAASFAGVDAGYQKIPVQCNAHRRWIKMIRLIIFLYIWCGMACFCFGQFGQKLTTRLVLTDELGNPLKGLEVGISYPDLTGNRYESASGKTDASGVYSFSGIAYKEVYYGTQNGGYYSSHRKEIVYKMIGEKIIYPTVCELSLVAKRIRNPIVMVADWRFEAVLPGPNIRVGYDLMKNDWVTPYGKGETADIYFMVSGEFRNRLDHDSLLEIDFPNEGDGLISFDCDLHQGSLLKSAHEAPASGYLNRKTTQKSALPVADGARSISGHDNHDIINGVKDGIGYYIRIRTVLDESGNAISAHYGKIYGDFDFFGADPSGSYVFAQCYYINPSVNDRNVEAIPGETLIPNLRNLDKPKLP